MTEQLPLPLRLDSPLPRLDQFDFRAQGLLEAELDARLSGAKSAPLLLEGPAGTGKSHLLGALTQAMLERDHSARLLPLRDVRAIEPAALGLDTPAPTCWLLDDLDAVVGERAWEVALFALLNRQHDARQSLIASLTQWPETGAFALPDLRSRLQQLTRITLQPLDDDGRRSVLRQRARDTGLTLPEAVQDWLDVNVSRDLRRQLQILAALDTYSLSRGRRLTVPLAREWLQGEHAAQRS